MKNLFRTKKDEAWIYFPLLIIIIAAAYIRVSGLTEYDLNPDSIWEITLAFGNPLDALIKNFTRYNHPPLNSIYESVMLLISHDELFMRIIPVIPGLIVIPVFFLLGRKMFGNAAGFFMAFFVAFSFAAINISEVFRPYSLMLLFEAAALTLLVEYEKEKDEKYLKYYFAAAFLTVFTNYVPCFIFAAIAAYGSFKILEENKFRFKKETLKKLFFWIGPHLLILSASFLYFYLQKGYEYFPYRPALHAWDSKSYPDNLADLFSRIYEVFQYLTVHDTSRIITVISIILSGWGLAAAIKKNKDIFFITLIFFTMFAAVVLLKQYPLSANRYSFFMLPLLLILMTLGFDDLLEKTAKIFNIKKSETRLKYFSVVVFLAFSLAALVYVNHHNKFRLIYSEFPLTKQKRAVMMNSLLSKVAKGDIVIMDNVISYYVSYETTLKDAELFANGVERINYQGVDFYYTPLERKYYFFDIPQLAEFYKKLSTIRDMKKVGRIWYFYPNPIWQVPLARAASSNNTPFYKIREYISDVYIMEGGSAVYFSINPLVLKILH